MKVTNNSGKRIILSLIVVMLLSLVVSSVFVYSIDEKKIRLDELASIKKLVLAERDKTFNIVKEKIIRLLSDTTPDDKKKDATTFEADKALAQKFIDTLIESGFLTPEQIETLNNLRQGTIPAAGAQAGRAEEKTWSGKWIWILLALLLLFGGAAFTNRGRKAYEFGGRLLKLRFGQFWFVMSGKKGKLDTVKRYQDETNKLSQRNNILANYINNSVKEKEKLILENSLDAGKLLNLNKLLFAHVIGIGQALELLEGKRIPGAYAEKIEPINLNKTLAELKEINKELAKEMNEIIINLLSIINKYKQLLIDIEKATNVGKVLQANLTGNFKTLFDRKINSVETELSELKNKLAALDRNIILLNQLIGMFERVYRYEDLLIEREINGHQDKKEEGRSSVGLQELTELLRQKKVKEFEFEARDIMQIANRLQEIFATNEKRRYEKLDKATTQVNAEIPKLQKQIDAINLDELNKLIEAAKNIIGLVQQLNQFKLDNNNKITAEQLKSFVNLVEQLKQDLPQVTLQEFKEQLEGFIIVHEIGEFMIVKVAGDDVTLKNVSNPVTFEQLKEIDKLLDEINIDNLLLDEINLDRATTIVPAAKKSKIAVISDIHSNLQAFEAVLADIKSQGISEIYCCGDIIGYNANPNECVKLIKKNNIQWVLGNHEIAILNKGYAEENRFNPSATAVVNWQIKELNEESKEFLNAQKQTNYILIKDDFVIVHGELTKPEDFRYLNKDLYDESNINFDKLLSDNFSILKKNNKRICFIGHVHIPEIWTIDANDKVKDERIEEGIVDITNAKNAIVNVGSVGQPRDKDNRACYVIYDKENNKVEIKYVRVQYDIKAAQTAITNRINEGYDADAANYMANRLYYGK